MESNMETKKCSRCGRELPVTEFGKNKRAKDGLQVFCKECFRQYARNKRVGAPKQGGITAGVHKSTTRKLYSSPTDGRTQSKGLPLGVHIRATTKDLL